MVQVEVDLNVYCALPGKVKQVEVDLNFYRALPDKVEQVEVDLNVYCACTSWQSRAG